MIDRIKELRPKLDIKSVGNAPNTIVLEYGRIEAYQSGSDQGVTPQLSAKSNWIWHGEALRLDVIVWVARIDGRGAIRTREQIWHIDVWIDTLHSERVAAKSRRKWYTSACLEHSPDLPPA